MRCYMVTHAYTHTHIYIYIYIYIYMYILYILFIYMKKNYAKYTAGIYTKLVR